MAFIHATESESARGNEIYFIVDVERAQIANANGRSVTVYPVVLKTNAEAYAALRGAETRVMKRYSDFASLHEELRNKFDARLPAMPSKVTVFRENKAKEERQREFLDVLRVVARERELRESATVVEFFCGRASTREGDGDSKRNAQKSRPIGGGRGREEDEDAEALDAPPANANANRGLESLLRSTMRVHGGMKSSFNEGEGDKVSNAVTPTPTPRTNAFDEEELKPTLTEVVDIDARSTATDGKSNDGDDDKFECSGRGAREAIKANDARALERLLNAGVDANHVDNTSNTLLHLAAVFNRKDAVEILLARGADRTVRNRVGETPMDVAPMALSMFMKRFTPPR